MVAQTHLQTKGSKMLTQRERRKPFSILIKQHHLKIIMFFVFSNKRLGCWVRFFCLFFFLFFFLFPKDLVKGKKKMGAFKIPKLVQVIK